MTPHLDTEALIQAFKELYGPGSPPHPICMEPGFPNPCHKCWEYLERMKREDEAEARREEERRNYVPPVPFKEILGKTISGIDLISDSAVNLVSSDGGEFKFELFGDCCSHSYYECREQFRELVGAKIQAVEQRAGKGFPTNPDDADGDEIMPHFLVFVTDKGHVTIDWRNESNGYYDGWVEMMVCV